MAAKSDRIVSYSSLFKLDNEHHGESSRSDFSVNNERHTVSPDPWSLEDPYQITDEPTCLDECDPEKNPFVSAQPRAHSEVNLNTVLSGIVAILTGRNKGLPSIQLQHEYSSSISSLPPESNGANFMDQSFYIPSAPPLGDETEKILQSDPPEWIPDSCRPMCILCKSPFTAFTRGRHHCRFCGDIFCSACSKGRCLLPVKFRVRDPQRVCDNCYDILEPLQSLLINSISNAIQPAKHDVTDWTCMRGWLNLPMGLSMEHEIYKASNTLRSYCQVSRLNPEKSIPAAVLKGAKGLAILTVAKAGALVTYKLGTGLVVSRRSDGSWSAPSAILSVGLGWGAQFGGELMDFIIVLRSRETVKAFCSRMHLSLGAGLSAAAGPVGRVFEADLRAGDRGSGMCHTYSCSKGAFVGVSLEGNVVVPRMDINLRFYGDPYMTTTDILLGNTEKPKAAAPLYDSLKDLYSGLCY